MDKTIAHTIRQYRDPYELDISMMWCYCYHLHSLLNLRDSRDEDNFNNTFRKNISANYTCSPETATNVRKVFQILIILALNILGGLFDLVNFRSCDLPDFNLSETSLIVFSCRKIRSSGKIGLLTYSSRTPQLFALLGENGLLTFLYFPG